MKLYDHQIEGVNFILKNNGVGALYFSCGLGKTATVLEIFRRYRETENIKLLVVCPLTLIQNAWIDDIKKFTTLTYQNLHENKAILNIKDVDVYLCNYEMLIGVKKLEDIKSIARNHKCMIVIDESSRMKNASSQTTKAILNMRKLFPYRILLSGSPAPNGEEEYWAQMKFLNDNIFSNSFYTFRNYFFHLQRGKQVMEIPRGSFVTKDMARKIFSQGFKYKITDNKRKEMMETMRPFVMFRELKDCVDLPESTEIIRKVTLNDEQRQAYTSMKNELVAELKGEIIAAQFALTKLNKLRQICGGFLISPEREAVDFHKNSKLEELEEVLSEIGDHQVIIWTWFIHEADIIKKLLGDKANIINGTVDETYKNESIQRFKDGQIQYLIANPQSIAHGVTLTNCHYCVYFSLSYSHVQHYQSVHRIMRIGQKNQCFYIYRLAEKTIDEVVFNVVKNKQKEEQIVKDFLK